MAAAVLHPSTALEPGDRFELAACPEDGHVPLPDYFSAAGEPPGRVLDPAGRPLEVQGGPGGLSLALPPGPPWGGDPGATVWLESHTGGNWRLVVEPGGAAGPAELTTEQGVPITPAGDDPAL